LSSTSQIRKDYYGQKADANGYETLTFLSWERHGRNDDRSKGTVNMGFNSGRGNRGTRRHARGGVVGSDDSRGYSSLVGGSRRDGYQGADGYGGRRDDGQPDGYGQPGPYSQPGDYGQPAQYTQPGEYTGPGEYGRSGRHDGPAAYGQPDRHATSPGRALSADLDFGDEAGRGGRTRARAGGPAAFRPGSGRGRRAASRGRGASRLRTMPVPVLAVVAVVASLAVVAAAVGATHVLTAQTAANAAAPNANCTLIVPANPLSAQGLATPYQLTATDPAAGPCNEANSAQTAFVQGAIINPATGTISIYDPLVVDAGTQAAVTPTVPTLPAGAVVGLWFGYNGNTLTLAGADQAQSLLNPSASATPTGATPTTTPSTTQSQAQVTPATSASGTATATSTPAATSTATATPTSTATSTATTPGQNTAAQTTSATQAAFVTGSTQRAGLEVTGSAPLPPAGSGSDAGYDATLTRIAAAGSSAGQSAGQAGNPPRYHRPSPSASASASASTSTSTSTSTPASTPATVTASASATSSTGTGTGTPTDPPAAGDVPAASGTPDAILQQASCVAGEDINGQFSSFTQVGACNAPAFFAAANTAIRAGKLTVPRPGIARDGQRCLTTRSFALIDQDQSDNVTTEYLAEPNGTTAQDTAANRQGLNGSSVLFNGSDNGLLDLFVDPALGCSPWEAPNLADGGALAPSLPLDELQAARWANSAGSPAALIPLNDPMTVDSNGNFSTDKTNTYRSLVDMPMLPAGQSPAAYCSNMEQIQGKRLQQDVNLLLNAPSPSAAAADNLFTFLAMRLQQSFMNLNCGNFGLHNGVSFSSDGNGVVVAACFVRQFAPVTRGPGNPMRGQRQCPTTVDSAPGGAGTPTATPTPKPSQSDPGSTYMRHHHRHWWW
jgi:hypothetical protein